MRYVVIGSLVVVGVVHLLPLSGVLGGERLAALYGLSFNDPNLAILMRHRALRFGLLGSFLIFAAFRPAFQPLAFVAGFASVISFLWLAWFVGGYNEHLGRVVAADIGALVCLGAGAAGYVHLRG
jgi:hypothetical protein